MPSPLERDAAVLDSPPATPVNAPASPNVRRKPHVCFVAPTAWPVMSGDDSIAMVGGAEVQQRMIAPALAARGYQVSMITLDHGQEEGTVAHGVTIYKAYRPDEGIPVVRFLFPRMTKLWDALKRVDADVYYQRTSSVSTAVTAAFCRRHGRYSIYAGASDVDFVPGEQEIAYARDRRIYEWGLKRVDRVFVQNEGQLESLRTHYKLDGILVPNCYAPPAGERAGRRGDYALWVATVRPAKRPELFIEMARRMPEHRFVMIGGADPLVRGGEEYFREVQAMAASVPNVEFLGFMPFAQAERWFDRARVVVNTSLYEGFPNTFLQSWSRGVPTVAFVDTGSRHEGMPVYDTVANLDEMAWKVDRLMREDILWQQLSQRAEAFYRDNHSIEAIAGIYERELSRAPVRP